MNEQRMQFAIGLVTLIAGFALAAIIIWFGEFQLALGPRRTYYASFKSAPGAEPKVPVRRAGIRVGEVRTVEYSDENSLVILTLILDGNYELREGDEPTLKRSLLGDTYVDIETRADMRGKKDRPLVPVGALMEGRSPLDANETIEQATSLVPSTNEALAEMQRTAKAWTEVGDQTRKLLKDNEKKLNDILDDTRDSMNRLSTTLDNINKILDPPTQENIRVTVKNIRESSEQMKPIIEASKKTIEQISSTTQQLDEISKNLQKATKPIADRSESVAKNIDESAQSLNSVLADFKTILAQFKTQDGTIQRLMNDPSLYRHLDDASLLVIKNLGDLDKVMKDLKVFADKIARHPGELGVQGVITRDSGLKTVPPTADGKHPFRR